MKNNFEKYKIFIATPCYGGMVTEGYMISIVNLTNKLYIEKLLNQDVTLWKLSSRAGKIFIRPMWLIL